MSVHPWVERIGHSFLGVAFPDAMVEGGMRYTRGVPPAIAGWSADAGPVSARLGAGPPRRASPFWNFSSSSCWWGWSRRSRFPNLERLQGAVTSKTERDYILDQFAGLGRQAMLRRRAYVVFGSDRAQDAGFSDIAGGTADARAQDWRTRSAGDGSGPPSFAGHDRYAIDLPEGWEIRLDEPLVVYANGLCLGAGLALYRRGEEDSRIVLEPPYCRVAPDA